MDQPHQRKAGTGLVVAGFAAAVLFPIVGLLIALFVMGRPGSTVIGMWIFVVSVALMFGYYFFLFAPA
jgi:hypothetical protein